MNQHSAIDPTSPLVRRDGRPVSHIATNRGLAFPHVILSDDVYGVAFRYTVDRYGQRYLRGESEYDVANVEMTGVARIADAEDDQPSLKSRPLPVAMGGELEPTDVGEGKS